MKSNDTDVELAIKVDKEFIVYVHTSKTRHVMHSAL